MSIDFDEAYEVWVYSLLEEETNPRVLSRLENGLEHGTLEFLRSVWFPVMKNFNHLQPEWEVRDFHNGYRYLDLAYMPGNGVKGGIEIQGYGPHARDLDVRRFKDLCWRHCLLTLDDWNFLPTLVVLNDIERISYEHETLYFADMVHVHFLTNSGQLIVMIWIDSGHFFGLFREISPLRFVRIPTCHLSR